MLGSTPSLKNQLKKWRWSRKTKVDSGMGWNLGNKIQYGEHSCSSGELHPLVIQRYMMRLSSPWLYLVMKLLWSLHHFENDGKKNGRF